MRLSLNIVLCTVVLAASATAGNIVLNGGFTSGDFTDWNTNTCSSAGCSTPGFSVAQLSMVFPTPDPGDAPTDTDFAASTGCGGVPCNDPTNGDWILQNLPTVASQTYTLTFLYDPGNSGEGTSELNVLWNGGLISGSETVDATAATWAQYTYTGLVATGSSTPLEFTGREDEGFLFLTDISVTADAAPGAATAPEPGSLLLMSCGLVGMAALRRRLRTQARLQKEHCRANVVDCALGRIVRATPGLNRPLPAERAAFSNAGSESPSGGRSRMQSRSRPSQSCVEQHPRSPSCIPPGSSIAPNRCRQRC